MTIKALYVYSPTLFKTDMTIEQWKGSLISPGIVTLQPGLYRAAATADIVPMPTPNTAGGIDYDVVTHSIVTTNGTKTTHPDPPGQAVQRLEITELDLQAWLQGGGEAVSI